MYHNKLPGTRCLVDRTLLFSLHGECSSKRIDPCNNRRVLLHLEPYEISRHIFLRFPCRELVLGPTTIRTDISSSSKHLRKISLHEVNAGLACSTSRLHAWEQARRRPEYSTPGESGREREFSAPRSRFKGSRYEAQTKDYNFIFPVAFIYFVDL